MNIFHSIKFRMVALGVFLVMIGIGIRLVFALPFAQTLLRDLVASEQMSIASYVAQDIDHNILMRRALITELSSTLPAALLQEPAELTRWTRERQRINPIFSQLLVLRPDGSGAFAEYPYMPNTDSLNYANSEWFKAALQADGTATSKPLISRASGRPILIMAAAVRDKEGRPFAVIAGVVALNSPGFLESLQRIRLGATGGFLLISPADELFIGASEPGMIMKPTPPKGVNLLHDRAMAGFRGSGITVNAYGVEELSTMVSVPSTGWFVVARMPTDEAFYPIKAVRNYLLIGTVVLVLGLIAVLMFALPRVLRPLTDMARSMREMADGTRQMTPLPIQRQDEVGDLVMGFNHLLARLNENESARKESEARLIFMAHHDPLTGLYNRATLEERIEIAFAHAARSGGHFALLFCDLDGFKSINDEYGHKAGDAVLCEIAARLSVGRRRTDTVARFGGDEFIVLITDLEDTRLAAIGVATQLLHTVGLPFDIDGHTITLGTSIGIALSNDASLSPSQMISRADIAMYRAKRAGKNGYRIFDEAVGS